MTSPLIFDVTPMLRGAATSTTLTAEGPAPERIGLNMAAFDKDAPLAVTAHITPIGGEAVTAIATVTGPQTIECARCLTTFTTPAQVDFTRVYTSDPNFIDGDSAEDSTDDGADDGVETITGTEINLLQALIDECGLSWPFSPVCADYGRTCNEEEVPAPDGESGKDEKNLIDPRWAGLEKFL